MSQKIRVAVLYGGKSSEHDVSLQSAAAVMSHLDQNRFEIVPVALDQEGSWRCGPLLSHSNHQALSLLLDAPIVNLEPGPQRKAVLRDRNGIEQVGGIDVVFPVLHGPPYEDGVLQGLLDIIDVPYVGSGVLGSATSMDKDVAKRLVASIGVSVVPSLTLRKADFIRDAEEVLKRVMNTFDPPMFIKPCNMGSSVGVHKIKSWTDLANALEDAFRYDGKVLVEKAVDAREIEVAVLGRDPLFVSMPCEINPLSGHEFYSYEAKYLDPRSSVVDLPAKLHADQAQRVRDLAARVFVALECTMLARVDFFLDRRTGDLFFNEINTLPGFTEISMYPKMIEASGIGYQALLTELVEMAFAHHHEKASRRRNH